MISRQGWLGLAAFAVAIGFLLWVEVRRAERVSYVANLAGTSAERQLAAADPDLNYGTVRGTLILPERHERGFGWLIETRRMLDHGEARIRWVDHENAPVGRAVFTASPYRWWLAALTRIERRISGRISETPLETAARFANPLVHLLVLTAGAAFCRWRFGWAAAVAFALGCVTLFPFAASFAPGVPDDRGFALCWAMGSLLPIVAGLRDGLRPHRWFAAAGVGGGLGLWFDVGSQIPVLIGVGLGGWMAQRTTRGAGAPIVGGAAWRVWSLAGALTSLAAYVIEYAPAHLGGWELRANHPLYALAWLGVGEWLARGAPGLRFDFRAGSARTIVAGAVALGCVAALPIVMTLTGNSGFLATSSSNYRLAVVPGGPVAENLVAWLRDAGAAPTVWATLLPMTVVVLLGWQWICGHLAVGWRSPAAFAIGPVLVLAAFGAARIGMWAHVDAALLVALVVGVAASAEPASVWRRASWSAVALGLPLIGAAVAWPERAGPATTLTRAEAEQLIERDLAHWLAARAPEPEAIVYATPHVTTSLTYYGGFRGIGTFAAGNEIGFALSLAIAGARTMEEVQWALQSRGVRYVVVPSWDPFFDDFAQRYLVQAHANRVSFFVHELRRWHLPAWLRPIAYHAPVIPGLESATALVFEVVEEQSPALATSRLAEVLEELGRIDEATEVEERLRRYPGDLGAWIARAQLRAARGDAAGFSQAVDTLRPRLAMHADRYLPWDRRVALAAVLAQAEQLELARPQVRRCVAEADDEKLRSLNQGALFRLLLLSEAFELPLPKPQRALAESLLPPALRAEL